MTSQCKVVNVSAMSFKSAQGNLNQCMQGCEMSAQCHLNQRKNVNVSARSFKSAQGCECQRIIINDS